MTNVVPQSRHQRCQCLMEAASLPSQSLLPRGVAPLLSELSLTSVACTKITVRHCGLPCVARNGIRVALSLPWNLLRILLRVW